MPDEYDGEIEEPVKIYSSIDDAMIPFGSVLHNPKSNSMFKLMNNNPTKEYYLKEMAQIIEKDENPRLPIYEYHIGVMVDSGIVNVRIKMHNKHETKYYRIAPVIMITSGALYNKAVKSKTLKNAFKQVFKLGVIGIAGTATWFCSSFVLGSFSRVDGLPLIPIIATTVTVSSGLILFFYFRKKNKKLEG